jgi:hypothetical protein
MLSHSFSEKNIEIQYYSEINYKKFKKLASSMENGVFQVYNVIWHSPLNAPHGYCDTMRTF